MRRFGSGPAGLIEALGAFTEQVRAHCRREAAFLHAINYPRRRQHEAQHAALMTQFDAMVGDYGLRGIQVFDETGQTLVRDCLLGHIVGSDREFVRAYFELCGLEKDERWLRKAPLVAGGHH